VHIIKILWRYENHYEVDALLRVKQVANGIPILIPLDPKPAGVRKLQAEHVNSVLFLLGDTIPVFEGYLVCTGDSSQNGAEAIECDIQVGRLSQ
jgi:hypothetical protein